MILLNYMSRYIKKKKKQNLWKMNVKINNFQSISKIEKIGIKFAIMITKP